MEEKDKKKFEENLKQRLETCFKWVTLYNIDLIKREIAKHFEIPESSLSLTLKEKTENETGEIAFKIYSLQIFDHKFLLRLNRRVEQPKEIKVPKVVKCEKKWYQFGEPGTKVVIEKQLSSKKPIEYWVITAIE